MEICQAAVETNFWPLLEVKLGKWKLNHQSKKREPIEKFLERQKRFRHLLKPENVGLKKQIQQEVDSQFARLLQLTEIS